MSLRRPVPEDNYGIPTGAAPPAYTLTHTGPPQQYPPPGNQAYPPQSPSHAQYPPAGNQGRPPNPQSPTHAQYPPGGATVQRGASRLGEDQLATLKRYDTVILIDDSASMQPYWEEVRQAIDGVVSKVIQYDDDGLDIYFLNSSMNLQSVRSHEAVSQLFNQIRPVGASTPTEVRVEEILGPYVDAVERSKQGGPPVKSLNLIIITDGAADDPDTLNYALAGFAERLDSIHAPLTQLGVQFVQIGNDPEATEFLRSLDDELKQTHGLKRDMVDATLYPGHITGDFIIKTLIGGINRRVDRGA